MLRHDLINVTEPGAKCEQPRPDDGGETKVEAAERCEKAHHGKAEAGGPRLRTERDYRPKPMNSAATLPKMLCITKLYKKQTPMPRRRARKISFSTTTAALTASAPA